VRFWIGLAVGVAIGAGGAWLLLERPWRGEPTIAAATVADAGAVDEGKPPTKRPRKRRGGRGGRGGERGGDGAGDRAEPAAPVLTAADRAIVQRGPAIQLPGQSVDLGASDDARPLTSAEIDDVIQRSSQPIFDCIESSRAGADLGGGTVRIELLVSGAGQVSKVRVSAPRWLIGHGLADCASAAARRWRFAATGAATLVDAPYHLD
jgi:hypothetical protein